jgi:Glycoside Hydrolase Family 113
MTGVRAPRTARLVGAAMAALAAACLAAPRAAYADFQRGVAYTAYSANAYGAPASDASLARLAQDGNTDVEIVATVYMANPFSTVVAPTSATPTDASILHAMATARSLGLRVTLKPQVDIQTGSWRGAITPLDPSLWFTSYEQQVDHYADLARHGGASMYVVGTELKTMSGPAYSSRWQQLIDGVRQRFGGQLTYAANYNEFQQIGFWSSLDYIGVDAYWPIASSSDQPVAALFSAWTARGYVGALQRAAAITGKPVLFTEVGYRSIVGATIHPGIWDSSAPYDMEEQSDAYESVYEALASQPWFAGLYWWSWPAALPRGGWNGDYTPTYKPAESVMKSWNAALSPAAAPAPASPVMPMSPVSVQHKPSTKHHRKKKQKKRHHRKKHRKRTGCATRSHSLRCRSV